MKSTKLLALVALLCLWNTWPANMQASRQRIIFDTDMGNDVDDVVALDLLLKYHEAGKANLLAIMGSRDAVSCCPFIDMYDKWFGYPNIPIGMVINGANPTPDKDAYSTKTLAIEKNGKKVFLPKKQHPLDYPNAVDLYRKILSHVPDKSVVIVAVGFSSNLARLMETDGDEYSPLNGTELLKRKVSYISIMAGNFLPDAKPEYNVWNDVMAARKLYTQSPVPLIFSTFDLGKKILYPGKCIQDNLNWTADHPLRSAYCFYKKMPYDRPCWDPTSALYALEPHSGFFGLSEKGDVSVDDKGGTTFTPNPKGNCQYLTVTPEQQQKVKDYLVKIVSQKPKRFQ